MLIYGRSHASDTQRHTPHAASAEPNAARDVRTAHMTWHYFMQDSFSVARALARAPYHCSRLRSLAPPLVAPRARSRRHMHRTQRQPMHTAARRARRAAERCVAERRETERRVARRRRAERAVRRARPDPQDVRPGFRDAPAKFYMVRASGHTRYCLKGNGVTFPASHQVFPTKVAVVIGSTSKPRPMRDGCQMLPCRSRPLVMNQGRSCSSMPRPLRHDRYLRCRSRRTVNAMR